MSRWFDIKRKDIQVDRDGKQVDILVTYDNDGNIYATIKLALLFKLVDEIRQDIGGNKDEL